MVERNKGFSIFANILLCIMSFLALFPFLLMIASSLSDEETLLTYGYSFYPRVLSLTAYQYIWSNALTIFRAYGITIFVTVVGTVTGVVCTVLLAYPLSIPDMPHRKLVSFLIYFTMLFNGGLVPTYMMYTNIFHLKNTIWALIIPALLMRAYYVILTRSYFQTSIPREVLEAARVDGASEFRIFWTLVWPMSIPIIATIGLMQGLAYWNDWTNGLYYINEQKLYSIQVLLNVMISDIKALQSDMNLAATAGSSAAANLPSTSIRMAIAVIGILPVLVMYPYFQKYFVKGLTLGAVKG